MEKVFREEKEKEARPESPQAHLPSRSGRGRSVAPRPRATARVAPTIHESACQGRV